MNEAFLRRDGIILTAEGAATALAAAVAKASDIGVPMCIAVVDAGGHLLAFTRMDGARIPSITIAQTKAFSAATRRRPTGADVGGDALNGIRIAIASGGRVTNVGGGLPIEVDGQTIGAVGVSSGTSDEDTIVAQAGVDAVVA